MRLLFSYPPVSQPIVTIKPKDTLYQYPVNSPIKSIFNSIFDRIKNTGKCNSCSGAR